MNEDEKNKFWIGKRAKIELLKDGRRLLYTAHILEIDSRHITFIDRESIVYSFNRDLVQEMQLLGDSK